MEYLSLLLIPVCAYLNMLGGRSPIAGARFIFRMLGIGVAFGLACLLCEIPLIFSAKLTVFAIAGQALWAVFKWGSGFMALKSTDTDNRDYSGAAYLPNYWVTRATDWIMGINKNTILSNAGIHCWGEIYMMLRGAFHYPFFILLGVILNPWAFVFGFLCLTQGWNYRFSSTVKKAEILTGAVAIGLPMALTLIAYKMGA